MLEWACPAEVLQAGMPWGRGCQHPHCLQTPKPGLLFSLAAQCKNSAPRALTKLQSPTEIFMYCKEFLSQMSDLLVMFHFYLHLWERPRLSEFSCKLSLWIQLFQLDSSSMGLHQTHFSTPAFGIKSKFTLPWEPYAPLSSLGLLMSSLSHHWTVQWTRNLGRDLTKSVS